MVDNGLELTVTNEHLLLISNTFRLFSSRNAINFSCKLVSPPELITTTLRDVFGSKHVCAALHTQLADVGIGNKTNRSNLSG